MKKKKTTEKAPLEPLPDDFCSWWNPSGIDAVSGAHIGGHPDATRVWARKDPGRWRRRTYGIGARKAWTCEPYRREYERWLDAGKPEGEEFISIAATLERQREFYQGIKAKLAQIGKPMPKEDKQPLPKALPDGETIEGEFEKIEEGEGEISF